MNGKLNDLINVIALFLVSPQQAIAKHPLKIPILNQPFLTNLSYNYKHPNESNIMNYQDIITIEPGKRSGKPCIRGMRITVYDILEYLAGGMTEVEIIEDFSELTSEDIKACLAFAADREKKLFVASI